MLDIAIRFYNRAIDEDFVYSTYLKSYAQSISCRAIPLDLYNAGARRRLDRLLNSDTNILIAHPPETPEMIYGWLALRDEQVVHYIYVKRPYRQQGIAKALLAPQLGGLEPTLYTHRGSEIWLEKKLREDPQYLTWFYNPFILEEGEESYGKEKR